MSLIIFDFDGTIADSFQYVYDFLSREAGPRKPAAGDVETYRHMSMKHMALQLGIPLWRLPYVYLKGRATMRRHILTVQPFPGMLEVIKALHDDGHTLAIVSSNSNRNIKRFLKNQEVASCFRSIKGNAGFLGKVAPLRQLKRRFGVTGAWYVGDEMTDVASAKLTGMNSLAVSWGFSGRHGLEELEPTAIVDEAADIPAAILKS